MYGVGGLNDVAFVGDVHGLAFLKGECVVVHSNLRNYI